MNQKIHIALLCGGQSAEHEISILSAQNILAGLNKEKYSPIVMYLSQQGSWYWVDPANGDFETQKQKRLILVPGENGQPFALENDPKQRIKVDCVIPMLHGTCGEDGSVQGLLDVLKLPYVGSDVLGSAICMQKHITKRLLRFAGLPTPDWLLIDETQADRLSYQELKQQFGEIFFVKPAALGSSVGISKVYNEKDYQVAIRNAFQYDSQLIIERYVDGREIECSVLGNDEPVASLPGEFITKHDFYSYEAKYQDPNSLEFITPAELPESTVKIIQELAVEAFKVLQCRGMARIDFFLTKEQEVFINEVNTIPGFTNYSMYPMNWKVSGFSYEDLLEDLIELAIDRHRRESSLSHFYLGTPGHSESSSQPGKELE